MNDLFIDCSTGISGDMLLGALFDLGVPVDVVNQALSSLGLDKLYSLNVEEYFKGGFRGTGVTITLNLDDFTNRSWLDIENYLRKSSLKKTIKEKAISVFREIAEAESVIHGEPLKEIHFHEIGSLKSLINIVSVCSAFEYLEINKVYSRTPPSGNGLIESAHGLLSAPVPVVLELARKNKITLSCENKMLKGELTTPTGIALLSTFVDYFHDPINLAIKSTGFGFGQKNIGKLSPLRICQLSHESISMNNFHLEKLVRQEAWIDDSSPEELSYLLTELRSSGALDVVCETIQMKKGRNGFCVKSLCFPEKSEELRLIFLDKCSTIGLQEIILNRYSLPRRLGYCMVFDEKIKCKQVRRPSGNLTTKPEYDDLVLLSKKIGKTFAQIKQEFYLSLESFTPLEDWK